MKADKLADVTKGAEELDALMTHRYGPEWAMPPNGWGMSDAEWKDYQNRELAKTAASENARIEEWRQSHVTLQKARRILREFMRAQVSISSLQPVMELAVELNPSLRDELLPEADPF